MCLFAAKKNDVPASSRDIVLLLRRPVLDKGRMFY